MTPPAAAANAPQEFDSTIIPEFHDYQIVQSPDSTVERKSDDAAAKPSAPPMDGVADEPWVDLIDFKGEPGTAAAAATREQSAMPIAKHGPSLPVQYYVELQPEVYQGKSLLGIRIALGESGHIIVTGMYPCA